jgi:hypothetical protein
VGGGRLVDRKLDLVRHRIAIEADLIERLRHQRVEGQADEEVERPDFGEAKQPGRHREGRRQRADQAADAIVQAGEPRLRVGEIG